MTPFLGQPVTGQQRQLAMMRYLNNARRERVRKELRDWGLELVDTAVISNGVLLKSDSTLRLGDGDVAGMATRGWFEMLSDQQVYSPVSGLLSRWTDKELKLFADPFPYIGCFVLVRPDPNLRLDCCSSARRRKYGEVDGRYFHQQRSRNRH